MVVIYLNNLHNFMKMLICRWIRELKRKKFWNTNFFPDQADRQKMQMVITEQEFFIMVSYLFLSCSVAMIMKLC